MAQTTQGTIAGQVTDSRTGRPVSGANVQYGSDTNTGNGAAITDAAGFYSIPSLTPGSYRIRVNAPSFQSREVQELELPVAARLEVDIRLRPLNDVWEAGQFRSVFMEGARTVLTFFGPDVDTSRSSSFDPPKGKLGGQESTLSNVIDSKQLRALPLSGRDVYTMLVTQPGANADAGTARGLGISFNGQRPSSSNFLLDGLENNNYLLNGPLSVIAPEAIQEYRISNQNYTAEYGRTSGYLANAITFSGGPEFHGIGYLYFKNEALNSNGFQRNLSNLKRLPLKELQPGFQFGGPLKKDKLFFSVAFDYFRGRSTLDSVNYLLPTTSFIRALPSDSLAAGLFAKFAPPEVSAAGSRAQVALSPPSTLNRLNTIDRVDYSALDGRWRTFARIAFNRVDRPDFVWSPYKDLTSPLKQNTVALAVGQVNAIRPDLLNDFRFGFSRDDLYWDRAHSEVPSLISADGTTLPSAPSFYSYSNLNNTWQLLDNITWSRREHTLTAGGGVLLRRSGGVLATGRDGQYFFLDLNGFAQGRANLLTASVARQTLPSAQQPSFDRKYRYNQYFLFAQDSYRVNRRVTISYGVRYENNGAPWNTGPSKDAIIVLGEGGSFEQRLAGARLTYNQQDAGNRSRESLAPRFGFSIDPFGNGATLLRGSYGLFYDRPFDNVWLGLRNNALAMMNFRLNAAQSTNYLAPTATVLPQYASVGTQITPPSLTMFDPNMRDAYAHNFFFGIQQRARHNVVFEVNGTGSQSRRVLTTDLINRQDFFYNRFNPSLPPGISYRAPQGIAGYYGLSAVLRHRSSRGLIQASYTWSHAIDNQSEPLALDLTDYGFTSGGSTRSRATGAGFLRQFDSRGDRGSSDFDQRQNFAVYSIWDLPGFLRHWRVSELAAFRSGFPYSVFGLFGRGDLLNPATVRIREDARGGVRLLDRAAFANPTVPPFTLGNTGRNLLTGPGLYNIDVSVSREFTLPRLKESARLVLRVDAFNVFNHANLNSPDSNLLSGTFGVATYGRVGRQSAFPSVSPLNESARQLQIGLQFRY